jgi:hypothetical protein
MDPQVVARLLGLEGYGKNVEIPYAQLVVPVEFQRKLNPRNWDVFIPALFGRAIVVEVEGEEILCDGLHRVEEGKANGMWDEQDVPCVRFANGTKEIAASIFHLGNRERTGVSSADQFRAACISGDAEALALDADLLEIGLDGWCQGRAPDGEDLGSIGTVVGVVEKYGRAHALYALDFIEGIWSWMKEDDRYVGSPNIRVIKGFSEYLRPEKRVKNLRRPRRWDQNNGPMLQEYIATNFPGEEGHESFIVRAQFRKAGGGGGGSAVGMEEEIHDAFKKAKRIQRDQQEEAA